MSRKGRPPKPTRLKLVEGNPGKRRLPAAEPKPAPTKPRRPSWLTPMARSEWERIVPELDALGLLAGVDRSTLAAYCEAVSTFKAATDDLAHRGHLVPSARGDGDLVKNPSNQLQRDAAHVIAKFSSMFGLSPSDRVRLDGAGHGDPHASLEALLS